LTTLVVAWEFFRVSRIILTLRSPGYLELSYPNLSKLSFSIIVHPPLQKSVTSWYQSQVPTMVSYYLPKFDGQNLLGPIFQLLRYSRLSKIYGSFISYGK
jgi:hypothetical protein